MDELWRQGSATVQSVFEALNARDTEYHAYSTVATVMYHLLAKGMARRRSHVYTPASSREEYQSARIATEIADLVDRYGDFAVVAMARAVERESRAATPGRA